MIRKIIFITLLVLVSINYQLPGQTSKLSQTIISGVVYDSVTGEPLPFVNVGFVHNMVGTITDINGSYNIKSANVGDTIVATCLGYIPSKLKIKKNTIQIVNFYMVADNLELAEVMVTPGENPAFKMLDNIKKRKKYNNPDRFNSVQYKSYNKLRLDINNIDEDFKKQKVFNQFQFVFEHIDTSEMFGKNFLPILISETVSRFYSQKSPPIEKEVIEAFKVSGIENTTVSQFSGKMYQKLNVYDNFITLFEPGFVSPISDIGRLYYKYLIEDSSSIDDSWCYKISFKPKRTKERTFYGYFWVADTSWAIKKIQLRVSSDVNINFMNDLVAVNEYQKINDSIWFLKKEDMFIDFNLTDQTYGFFGRKQATYEDIKFNEPIPENVEKLMTNTYVDEDSVIKDDAYWETHRDLQLDEKEKEIYTMVDSVKEVPMFKSIYSIMEMLVNYYYIVGPVEIGPYYTMYSHNVIEGHRFKLSGRTRNEFSTKYMFGGHIAYGTDDQKFKYGAYVDYMVKKNPRRCIELSYYNDMRQLGKSQNAFLDDNILETILRRRPNYKLTMVEQYNGFYEHEWFQGFSNKISFTHQTIFPTQYVPFEPYASDGTTSHINSLTTTELKFNTHFGYKEKFLWGKFERASLGSKYPVIDINLTYSPKGLLGNKYDFIKVQAQVYDKILTSPFGFTRCWFTAGKIIGSVPYPLLELHQGNETYANDIYAYNMMNYYEFASDEYMSIFAEQHLQGFFMNKIPLIRRLEWREIASVKFLTGHLSEENQNVMAFPQGLTGLSKPYMEVGTGLENIFKFFRVEAVWRLSYLDNPDIQKFSVRALMQITF